MPVTIKDADKMVTEAKEAVSKILEQIERNRDNLKRLEIRLKASEDFYNRRFEISIERKPKKDTIKQKHYNLTPPKPVLDKHEDEEDCIIRGKKCMKYKDFPKSYKKDSITFGEKFGSSGELVLSKYCGVELTAREIADIATEEGILKTDAEAVAGNLDQRLKSRWCLYYRRDRKTPYYVIHKKDSESGLYAYIYDNDSVLDKLNSDLDKIKRLLKSGGKTDEDIEKIENQQH